MEKMMQKTFNSHMIRRWQLLGSNPSVCGVYLSFLLSSNKITYDIPKTGNKHLHTSKKGFVSIFPSSDLTRDNPSKAGLNTDDPSILFL